MVPGNTVWTYAGFEDGASRLVQSLQRSHKKEISDTCLRHSGDCQSESEGDLGDAGVVKSGAATG